MLKTEYTTMPKEDLTMIPYQSMELKHCIAMGKPKEMLNLKLSYIYYPVILPCIDTPLWLTCTSKIHRIWCLYNPVIGLIETFLPHSNKFAFLVLPRQISDMSRESGLNRLSPIPLVTVHLFCHNFCKMTFWFFKTYLDLCTLRNAHILNVISKN